VNDRGVLEPRRALNGALERPVHVHGEDLDDRLLLGGQRVEPAAGGLFAAAVADSERPTGLEIADDDDELVFEAAAPAEPPLIDADRAESDDRQGASQPRARARVLLRVGR